MRDFYPENGGRSFDRNFGKFLNHHIPSHPGRQNLFVVSVARALRPRIRMIILLYYFVVLRRSKLSHLRKPTGLCNSSASLFLTHVPSMN